MKSILTKFAENLLSRDEMKDLKGGNMPAGCAAGACKTHGDCTYLGCACCSVDDGSSYGSCIT